MAEESTQNQEQQMFQVLYDGIGVYEDEELENETFSIMLEKDSIIPGTYINDKVVLFGDPFNVYCSSINVEPSDITPSQYNNKKHEYDSTVIIHVQEPDQLQELQQLQATEEQQITEDPHSSNTNPNSSNDYVVVEEQKSAATSEFEAISPSDAQSSDPSNQFDEETNSQKPLVTPPAQTYANDNDNDQDNEEYNVIVNTGSGMPPPPISPSIEAVNNNINPPELQSLPPAVPDVIPNDDIEPSEPPTQSLPPPVPPDVVQEDDIEHIEYEELPIQSLPPPAPEATIQKNDIEYEVVPTQSLPPPAPQDAVIQKDDEYEEYEEYEEVPTQSVPPPVPQDAVQQNVQEYEEDMEVAVVNVVDDDMDIVEDINSDYVGGGAPPGFKFSTGSPIEDLDNLLRMYRHMANDKEREEIYNEFWNQYAMIQKKDSHLLLQIPCRVRGFLTIMDENDMEPYRRDRIMIHVLSRNGLLEEPDYIDNRYLFSYFISYEIFNYLSWFVSNCCSLQGWMFFFLIVLMFAEIIHIGIDFGSANPWRAILMECLVPLTFIAAIQFVDTTFTSNILRSLIENKCAALCTVYGRVSLNVLIIFFCLGSVEMVDAVLLFAALMCGIWTVIIFVSFSRLKHASNYVRIATGTTKKLQEKFAFADEDKDGILNHYELRNFFKSYNQIVGMWQIDLMISQYDIHKDNGLRFDALSLWFQKLPVDHQTRMTLLSYRSSIDMNAYERVDNDNANVNLNANKSDAHIIQPITTASGPKYTEAEKEYMDLFVGGRRGTMDDNYV